MSDRLTVQFKIIEGDVPTGQMLWADYKVGILQGLDLAFEDGRWHVSSTPEGMSRIFHGHGDHMDEAVLDWLADRLDLKPEPSPSGPEEV